MLQELLDIFNLKSFFQEIQSITSLTTVDEAIKTLETIAEKLNEQSERVSLETQKPAYPEFVAEGVAPAKPVHTAYKAKISESIKILEFAKEQKGSYVDIQIIKDLIKAINEVTAQHYTPTQQQILHISESALHHFTFTQIEQIAPQVKNISLTEIEANTLKIYHDVAARIKSLEQGITQAQKMGDSMILYETDSGAVERLSISQSIPLLEQLKIKRAHLYTAFEGVYTKIFEYTENVKIEAAYENILKGKVLEIHQACIEYVVSKACGGQHTLLPVSNPTDLYLSLWKELLSQLKEENHLVNESVAWEITQYGKNNKAADSISYAQLVKQKAPFLLLDIPLPGDMETQEGLLHRLKGILKMKMSHLEAKVGEIVALENSNNFKPLFIEKHSNLVPLFKDFFEAYHHFIAAKNTSSSEITTPEMPAFLKTFIQDLESHNASLRENIKYTVFDMNNAIKLQTLLLEIKVEIAKNPRLLDTAIQIEGEMVGKYAATDSYKTATPFEQKVQDFCVLRNQAGQSRIIEKNGSSLGQFYDNYLYKNIHELLELSHRNEIAYSKNAEMSSELALIHEACYQSLTKIREPYQIFFQSASELQDTLQKAKEAEAALQQKRTAAIKNLRDSLSGKVTEPVLEALLYKVSLADIQVQKILLEHGTEETIARYKAYQKIHAETMSAMVERHFIKHFIELRTKMPDASVNAWYKAIYKKLRDIQYDPTQQDVVESLLKGNEIQGLSKLKTLLRLYNSARFVMYNLWDNFELRHEHITPANVAHITENAILEVELNILHRKSLDLWDQYHGVDAESIVSLTNEIQRIKNSQDPIKLELKEIKKQILKSVNKGEILFTNANDIISFFKIIHRIKNNILLYSQDHIIDLFEDKQSIKPHLQLLEDYIAKQKALIKAETQVNILSRKLRVAKGALYAGDNINSFINGDINILQFQSEALSEQHAEMIEQRHTLKVKLKCKALELQNLEILEEALTKVDKSARIAFFQALQALVMGEKNSQLKFIQAIKKLNLLQLTDKETAKNIEISLRKFLVEIPNQLIEYDRVRGALPLQEIETVITYKSSPEFQLPEDPQQRNQALKDLIKAYQDNMKVIKEIIGRDLFTLRGPLPETYFLKTALPELHNKTGLILTKDVVTQLGISVIDQREAYCQRILAGDIPVEELAKKIKNNAFLETYELFYQKVQILKQLVVAINKSLIERAFADGISEGKSTTPQLVETGYEVFDAAVKKEVNKYIEKTIEPIRHANGKSANGQIVGMNRILPFENFKQARAHWNEILWPDIKTASKLTNRFVVRPSLYLGSNFFLGVTIVDEAQIVGDLIYEGYYGEAALEATTFTLAFALLNPGSYEFFGWSRAAQMVRSIGPAALVMLTYHSADIMPEFTDGLAAKGGAVYNFINNEMPYLEDINAYTSISYRPYLTPLMFYDKKLFIETNNSSNLAISQMAAAPFQLVSYIGTPMVRNFQQDMVRRGYFAAVKEPSLYFPDVFLKMQYMVHQSVGDFVTQQLEAINAVIKKLRKEKTAETIISGVHRHFIRNLLQIIMPQLYYGYDVEHHIVADNGDIITQRISYDAFLDLIIQGEIRLENTFLLRKTHMQDGMQYEMRHSLAPQILTEKKKVLDNWLAVSPEYLQHMQWQTKYHYVSSPSPTREAQPVIAEEIENFFNMKRLNDYLNQFKRQDGIAIHSDARLWFQQGYNRKLNSYEGKLGDKLEGAYKKWHEIKEKFIEKTPRAELTLLEIHSGGIYPQRMINPYSWVMEAQAADRIIMPCKDHNGRYTLYTVYDKDGNIVADYQSLAQLNKLTASCSRLLTLTGPLEETLLRQAIFTFETSHNMITSINLYQRYDWDISQIVAVKPDLKNGWHAYNITTNESLYANSLTEVVCQAKQAFPAQEVCAFEAGQYFQEQTCLVFEVDQTGFLGIQPYSILHLAKNYHPDVFMLSFKDDGYHLYDRNKDTEIFHTPHFVEIEHYLKQYETPRFTIIENTPQQFQKMAQNIFIHYQAPESALTRENDYLYHQEVGKQAVLYNQEACILKRVTLQDNERFDMTKFALAKHRLFSTFEIKKGLAQVK